MDLPVWLVALAVIPPLVIFFYYVGRSARVSRYQAVALFAAFAYGMGVEALALHTTHDYDYANCCHLCWSGADPTVEASYCCCHHCC